ncbi:hypothetical protein [Rhizobium sp. CNPSo 3490]|uniref:hypothetical protein n=1 Tax=Rhizobium sp. CNPSo 3490 TaxID=3021407 RepID=UPI00254E9964|nr:hypothetical protein [Rhizobium sp. CNPSo 3490]MDK4732158.1 hypothetical protein [Rhizobium sp. CNPSo 3490]
MKSAIPGFIILRGAERICGALVHLGMPVSHYYLLETGIASMVATSPEGRKADIGVLGRNGMSPPP